MALPSLLLDIASRHAVYMEGAKTRYAKAFDAFLRQMERAILEELAQVDMESIGAARLTRLLDAVRSTIAAGLQDYERVWREQIREFGEYSAEFEIKALQQVVQAEFVLPSPAQIYTAAFAKPLSVEGIDKGQLLEPFFRDWTDKQQRRVTGALRIGAAQGQTTGQVVRAIRGTRAAGYKDGIIEASRRDVTMMARTALQHVSAEAKAQVYAANVDIVTGVTFLAVLDNRTTALCRGLSGQEFPVGKGPQPPLHIGCRSQLVPILDDGLDFLDGAGRQFSRGADGIKRVGANLTYYEWLKTQPAAFQDTVVGATRGKLLRNGGLTAERFQALQLDKTFRERTIDEMRALEPTAFSRAGI
jgi:SPP1 gp7 family putative phage head morphogenesis protein